LKDNEDPANREKGEKTKEETSEPSLKRFKKLFSGLDIEEDVQKTESKQKSQTAPETEKPIEDKLLEHEGYKYISSNKKKLKKILGGSIGVIFILAGLLLLTTAALRVVDNVAFGERAMFSALLVIIGMLILAFVFSKELLHSSLFKKLNIHINDENLPDKKDNIDDKDKM
jgi:hypothetical protein